ncbi:dihydrodipicolinate synthase family protein, partial [Burkholderia sp. Tr-860]|uniref:dihydrodipicolinate synthase family protein n=1 Tax=Burkholderia sp. Tr-860 TaxID=2608338 RepID=UPI001F048CB6
MSIDFSGIWLPIVTPFAGEAVDHDALARLARHHGQAGIAGFVACATTGEGASVDIGNVFGNAQIFSNQSSAGHARIDNFVLNASLGDGSLAQ